MRVQINPQKWIMLHSNHLELSLCGNCKQVSYQEMKDLNSTLPFGYHSLEVLSNPQKPRAVIRTRELTSKGGLPWLSPLWLLNYP